MKKVLSMLVATLLSVSAFAQISGLYAGGNIGFSATKGGGNTLTFLPDVGFSLNDSFALGMEVGFSTESATGFKEFSICPYLRYNAVTEGILTFFVDGNVNYYCGKDNFPDSKYSACDIYLAPGVELALSDHFCLDIYIGNFGYSTDTETFGFNIGPVNSIGLYYCF